MLCQYPEQTLSNFDKAIQLVNELSLYASRVVIVTINTAAIFHNSIRDMPYATFGKPAALDKQVLAYQEIIAQLVNSFGEKLQSILAFENGLSKTSIEIQSMFGITPARNEPGFCEGITDLSIDLMHLWFIGRIDDESKKFLKAMVDQIYFLEVNYDQQ